MPVKKISGILYSLSFYLNDIVLPTLGYIIERKTSNNNTDIVNLTGNDNKKWGSLKNNNILYFDPTDFAEGYARAKGAFQIQDTQIFDTSYNIITSLPGGTQTTLNYRKGIIELENLSGGLNSINQIEMEYTAKDYTFLTTFPESSDEVNGLTFCLQLFDQDGIPYKIGSDAEFYKCNFILDYIARTDIELIEIGEIIRKSLRVSFPIFDFETESIYPTLSNGEPNPSFSSQVTSTRWCDSNSSISMIPNGIIPGVRRHQASARIRTSVVL